MNKRFLVANGVFGVSDHVVGGFASNFDSAIIEIEKKIRTREEVHNDYLKILEKNEVENQELVASAEDILFTTFTKELKDKVKISPRYIEEKSKEVNNKLWLIAKYFFLNYRF